MATFQSVQGPYWSNQSSRAPECQKIKKGGLDRPA